MASWCVAGRLLHSPLTALNAAARAVRKNGELRGPAQASFYESLVQEAALKTASSGEWVQVTVPALSLWGLLVVTPQK
ncbi:MAG: hypothetical protein WCG03_06705 [Kiritimatiellales bacterium]